MFMVVDDYRKPSTQSVFLRTFHHMRCLLLCRQQSNILGANAMAAPYKPSRPDIDWMDLMDALSRFIDGLHYMKAGAKPLKDMSKLLKNLSTRLAEQRELNLEELQIFDAEHTRWQGTLSVKDEVVQGVTKAKILSVLPLDSLIHGALQRLDVPSPFPDHLLCVQYILDHSPRLQGITLPAKVNSTLAHMSFVSQQCHIPSHGLIVILQHWANEKWRVVAQVRIRNQDRQKVDTSRTAASKAYFAGKENGSVIAVEFQDWKQDDESDLLEDSSAALLDAATTVFPSQSLSHASALAIHGLVYISPLLELHLENVHFQDERDWHLVIGAVDLPSLYRFYRPRSYIQHVKVSVPEQLVSTTVEDDIMFSVSKTAQSRRTNRSREIVIG
ncbi:hypothetical protein BG000_008693 [Podila horticola]|nr:hypothetical protein BG000_008693 [Podila horticola]